MSENLRPFVGQKAFINKNGKILILFDEDNGDGTLDLPGGRIQEGESDLVESLKREVLEETGLDIEVGEPYYTWLRTIPTHQTYLVAYKCDYKSGELKLSEEHNSYEWVDKSSYKKYQSASSYFKAIEKYFEGS